MKILWIIVICVSVVVLLVFLCLFAKFCCSIERKRNQDKLRREREIGFQQASTRLFQREHQFQGLTQFNVESDYRSWNKAQTKSFDNQFQSPLKYSYPTKLPVESQNHRHPRNESRTIPKQVVQAKEHQTKKSRARSCPRPQSHFSDKRVLKVKRLAKVAVPDILREKHIAKTPVTQKIATDLSKKRKQSCHETGEIFTNTVFDNPKVLVKSKVLNHDWNKSHGQVIFVSEKKLKTFQCKKNQKTSDWTAQEIEPRHALFASKAKSFHLLKEFLEYDEVNFVCDVEE